MKTPHELRTVLGVVPQEIALYDELTAKENLKFFGRIHRIKKEVIGGKLMRYCNLSDLNIKGITCQAFLRWDEKTTQYRCCPFART